MQSTPLRSDKIGAILTARSGKHAFPTYLSIVARQWLIRNFRELLRYCV
jgi:hypothetical protein